jgi:hypothetical protein
MKSAGVRPDVPVKNAYTLYMFSSREDTASISTSATVPPTEQDIILEPPRRRRGRPPRSEPIEIVKLSVPGSLHQALTKEAEATGSSVASYILRRVTERSPPRIVPAVNVRQWDSLRRMFEDLAGRILQAAPAGLEPEDVARNLLELSQEVRKLRLVLVNAESSDDSEDP